MIPRSYNRLENRGWNQLLNVKVTRTELSRNTESRTILNFEKKIEIFENFENQILGTLRTWGFWLVKNFKFQWDILKRVRSI